MELEKFMKSKGFDIDDLLYGVDEWPVEQLKQYPITRAFLEWKNKIKRR